MENISKTHFQAEKALTSIVFFIERYEICLPGLEVFRLALFEKRMELSKAFTNYSHEALKFIPHDVSEEKQESRKTVKLKKATTQDVQNIQKLSDQYIELSFEIVAYIYDLSIIIQNSLLGHIFNKTLSGRKRLNEDMIILKSDDNDDMKKLKGKLLKSGSHGEMISEVWFNGLIINNTSK